MKSNLPKVVPLFGDRRPAPVAANPMTVEDALAAHLDRLHATARILSGSVALAEDLVQETAIAAFRAWGQLRSHEAVRPWLLRILMRVFLNTQSRVTA